MSFVVLTASLGTSFVEAPMQCARKPDPELRTEDSAGDALWALAMDFRAHGDERSAQRTLQFLVEKYPSNRHVPAAKAELSAAPAKPSPSP